MYLNFIKPSLALSREINFTGRWMSVRLYGNSNIETNILSEKVVSKVFFNSKVR
jgi:hypothetical protein